MENISQELPIAVILLRLSGVVALFVVGRWFAKNSRSWLKKILLSRPPEIYYNRIGESHLFGHLAGDPDHNSGADWYSC